MSLGQTVSPTLSTESRGGRILRHARLLPHGIAYTVCRAYSRTDSRASSATAAEEYRALQAQRAFRLERI